MVVRTLPLHPPLGSDIFDSGPKLAKLGQKPPKTGPKPAPNQPKPVQNKPQIATTPVKNQTNRPQTGPKPAKIQNLFLEIRHTRGLALPDGLSVAIFAQNGSVLTGP